MKSRSPTQADAFWYTDANGSVQSGPAGSVESFEPSFQQDLNGDGVIGYAVPAAGSLELSGAISASVQFIGSTGTLTLDNSSQFSGQVLNFTGAGSPSTSDQIDLKDVNANSASFSHSFNPSTDVLTVGDGTHTATLHFVGTYAAQNFKFASDGANGTIVYDPPVASNGPAPAGAQGQDSFTFNPATNTFAPPQMLAGDLHGAVHTQVTPLDALLSEPAAATVDEALPRGFGVVAQPWLAQHDFHVS
jgi:hypothetical protein